MNQISQTIPAMTPPSVHDFLYEVGRQWQGKGTAIELGCWLGASAIALLTGLKEAGYDRPFYAMERWIANEQQVELTRNTPFKLKLDQDVQPIFLRNLKEAGFNDIISVKGNLSATTKEYNGGDIEICIFDAPKTDPTFINCVLALHQFWIPGVTVLGLLDYHFYKRFDGSKHEELLAPVRFMEHYGNHFELMREWPDKVTCSAFFRYIKKLEL